MIVDKMKYLSITLRLMALYMMVMGVFAIFFQDAAEFMYLFQVVDPITTRMWGGALVGLSIFYLLASYDVEKYRLLLWAGVLQLTVSFLLTVYHMGTRIIEPAQGMIRMIVTPIFLIILLSGILSHKKEKVLFEVGGKTKGEPQGPEQIREQHPLQGK